MSNENGCQMDLKRVLANAQLPALPQSAIRLLELSQDPANGPIEFAVPIEVDPGLTGQVLKFVNSSYFGFSREISSIKLAITLVGIRTIKNFALWSAVFSLMPNPKCGPFVLKSLWQDSLRRALFARSFAKLLGIKEPEEQFAAALLQDMAVPLLAKENPKSYVELLEARDNGHVRLSHLEKTAFGWTHGEAAGMMARQWNLPEAFADLIESHDDIERHAANVKAAPGKTAVALSALLPSVVDTEWPECGQFEHYYEKTVPPGGPSVPELLAQIDELFVSFAPVLKVSNPSKSLVECHQEVAAPAVG
jgi:HD-like signal output (HDOD) protein